MAGQVRRATANRPGVRLVQLCLGHTAVVLERAHRRHQHDGRRVQPGIAALDVEEFFRAEVRAETGFGDDIIGQLEAQTGGGDAVAAVRNVRKRTAVDDGGVVFKRLHKVGVDGVLEQRGHRARRADLPGRDRLAVVGIGADDAGQALFEVLEVGGQAEDGHDLAGDRDVEAVLTRGAVDLAAKAVDEETQLAVVHVHAALPGDAARVDVQRVALLDGVVDHGRQQVVGGADGVDVPGEMEVDVLHRHDLGVAAAGRAALDAEHRAQARLAQAEHRALAQRAHRIGQADAGGGLSLPGRGRADGGDKDQLAFGAFALGQLVAELGFVAAVGDDLILRHAELGRHFGNGQHLGALGDLDIG